MIKFLIGGSPCTHWSIAQSKNRETTAEGMGWELFRNYLIVKKKFKPDFFLYENNKSASQAIKDQIAEELGVPLQYINSALVSAQNRQRFYAHNFGNVPQPEDRRIQLKDIIESGETWLEKSYALTTRCAGAIIPDTLKKHRHTMIGEPIILNTTASGKAHCLRATCYKDGIRNMVANNVEKRTCVALPVYAEGSEEGAAYYATPAGSEGKARKFYKVENGLLHYKGSEYEINLADGFYIFRKLTVTEASRLQTMPDDYCHAVSDAQAYKGLGNGWTAEVIIHLLSYALAGVPKDEEILVLSMYDGIGTGRYCFDKLGYKNIKYFAYEIDKYAMQIANNNYEDIIQCGDAFQVREEDWKVEQ